MIFDSRFVFLFCSLCLLLSLHDAFAEVVTGRVTNTSNQPLSFANVYVKGTTKGTTTNIDGYYKLEVPAGKMELVFRFVGYKMKIIPIEVINEPIELNVELVPEKYTLSEVKILADAEDPSYQIIRNAIDKRKFYLNQVEEYSCDVYIKGLQKLTKYPEKFFGVEVNLDEFVDSTTGIVYLSESVSQYYFKQPEEEKEVMISSKVSGSNRAFSFNRATEMDFNFYNNNMMVGELSQRGFVSPIASNALFYYRYRLDGSFFENDRWVNRIEVIPKRKNDPVFSGYIYIQDSTWRIHSTDLYLTKDSQIEFVDTLRVGQTYIPVDDENEKWLLGSATFYFVFGAFGFEGNGNFVGVYSSYDLNPGLNNKFFRGSIMKVEDEANKKDSLYWDVVRPVPLTLEERNDYNKRDSLQVIKESKPYLDSLDKVSNKFKFGNIITGYTIQNRYRKSEYRISSILDFLQFNTVEGLNTGVALSYEKEFENNKSFSADITARYGWSNEKISYTAGIEHYYNAKKFANILIEGGDNLVQFNQNNPISAIVNTGYILFDEKNYMKLFRKRYGKVAYQIEPVNGIRLSANVEYATRNAVANTTNYSFSDRKESAYTSNNPTDPVGSDIFFEKNEALLLNVLMRIRFKQKYIDRPDMNYILGSKYPTFFIKYSKGVKNFIGSDVDFDRIELGVEDRIRLRILGSFSYRVIYGNFINSAGTYFTDFTHINGNQTFLSGFKTSRFDLLEYYKYSTSDEYLQVFTEHDFGGFIFNKIPGVRKLKLNEIAGFRYLYIPDVIQHYEFSFGLEKLGFLRADFVFAFDENGKTNTGFVIGIKSRILQ